MDVLAIIAGPLLLPSLLLAVGKILQQLLPLLSDRVNARAVRLAKAKNQRSK